MIKVKELYTRITKEDRPEVVYTDKKNVLIGSLEKVISATHHIVYIWQMNKSIQA